jgi:hypothetical protein
MATSNRRVYDEEELEIALRLQKLEIEMEAVATALKKNTLATEELLKSWEGSKFTVTLAKKAGALGIFFIAIATAWYNYKRS